MPDYNRYPEQLHEILEIFEESPVSDQHEMLLDFSDRFEDVPERIATRPFPEEHRVPACESEAFVFTEPGENGNVNFYFAVENPQGVSAKALAAILQEALQGADLDSIERVPEDFIYELFGRSVAMGKGAGLMGMISLLKHFARKQQHNTD
jgi:cysteine desulfuration protein SufE